MTDLEKRVAETRELLQRQKRRLAERELAGEEAAPGELAAITKLELTLHNLEHFSRLRELTRDPDPVLPELSDALGRAFDVAAAGATVSRATSPEAATVGSTAARLLVDAGLAERDERRLVLTDLGRRLQEQRDAR